MAPDLSLTRVEEAHDRVVTNANRVAGVEVVLEGTEVDVVRDGYDLLLHGYKQCVSGDALGIQVDDLVSC